MVLNKISELLLIITAIILGIIVIIIVLKKSFKNTKYNKKESLLFGSAGMIAYFLDTLGIGSFAILTTFYTSFKLVKPKYLPGTLNICAFTPVLVESIFFRTTFKIDAFNLLLMVIFSCAGAIVGAEFVKKINIQAFMKTVGIALIFFAILFTLKNIGIFDKLDEKNTLTSLGGIKLLTVCIIVFGIGILNSFGVGSYAPTMTLLLIMGLSPGIVLALKSLQAYFLQNVTALKYVSDDYYNKESVVPTWIGGTIGVVIASIVISKINVDILLWIVVPVIFITGLMFIFKKSS